MPNAIKYFALALLIAESFKLFAAEQLPVSFDSCKACHGNHAEGNPALGAPRLSGLDAVYLKRQLRNFQQGIRGSLAEDKYGQQMKSVSFNLGTQDIDSLANALSQQDMAVDKEIVEGDIESGKKYFLSNCAACHGNQAQGNPRLNAPQLTLQTANYLSRQLSNFRNGIRGSSSEDKFGRQMAMMAKTLPDEKAVTNVIAYIKSL